MPEEVSPSTGDPAPLSREQLIEECARWVDEGLRLLNEPVEGDQPPDVPLPAVDLFSLYGELKGLREDMKRDLRRNADFIEEFRQSLGEIRARAEGERFPEKTMPGELKPDALLDALFDLYNRSSRLISLWEETLRAKSFLLQLCGVRRLVEDMVESQRIFARKCEARFKELSIEVTGKPGEPFNPLTMKAIDVRPGGAKPGGTVLEVARHGFTRGGATLCCAEVVVAEAKT